MEQKKILLIDDSHVSNMLLQNILENEGHKVFMSSSGSEGLDMIRKIGPDLVLLDVMMPEMDGMEVLKIILSDKEMKHIPVIMLTAKKCSADMSESMRLGAIDYINKPIDNEHVASRVNSIIKERVK